MPKLFGRRPPPPPAVAAALDALARLAEDEPALAGPAAVQGALLRAAAEAPALALSLDLAPERATAKLAAGEPLLRGEPLALDEAALARRFARLAEAAAGAGAAGAELIVTAHRRGQVQPAALARAVLAGDGEAVAARAAALGLPADLLGALLRFTLFGPLSELAARLAPLRAARAWDAGYCPTCGGWPLLGEQRGLEQLRFLRCGICASEWAADRLRCVYCGARDHERLAYLFVDGDERSRVATCEECRGYLKLVNSLAPIPPYELLVQDLATLPLDMAALERGYAGT
jgi:FdhE protein